MRFLVIDDHPLLAEGLKTVVSKHFPTKEFFIFPSGVEAIKVVRENKIDLIFLDLFLPNNDTLGLLHKILVQSPETKVLIYSNAQDDIFALRYLKAGAHGFLNKSANVEETVKCITAILKGETYVSPHVLSLLGKQKTAENPFGVLSNREFEVMTHLINGESIKTISEKLKLHTSTIGTQKSRIYKKLNLSNIAQLIELANLHNITTKN